MSLQFKDVVDCLEVLNPNYDLVFMFDHSSHKQWLSGYTHHTCGRRPKVQIPQVLSSALPMSGSLVMASLLYSPDLWQGSLRHELQLSILM
jgi:hypothetical protein